MASFSIIAVILGVWVTAAQEQKAASTKPAAGLTQSAEETAAYSRVLEGLEWPLDLAQLEKKIRAATPLGQEPMGVTHFVNSQLLPQVKQTGVEIQGSADAAEQAVNECKNYLWSAEKEVSHRETIMEQDESERFKCIAMEHRLHKEQMDTCGDLKFLAELIQKTKPKALSSLTNRTVDDVLAVLRESQEFYFEMAPKMVTKDATCTSAKQASINAHAECEADEEVIEAFYCTMKYGRDQACKQYAECYAEKSASFDTAMAEVKSLEAHNKERFKQLTCYASEKRGKECESTVNVASLAVSYPAKPTQETCIHLMKTRRSYTDIVCKEGSVVPHGDYAGGAEADSNATVVAK